MPSVVISPPFSPHFHSFIIHILPPRSPPLFLCVLLSFAFFSSLSLTPLHPSDSPLCSKKPFLNSSVRSDPFHQPEKSQLSAFLWLSLFYHSHGVLWLCCWLPAPCTYLHTHTHVIHIHTCSKQYTHTGEERPERHVYEDLDVCVYTVFGLCVKWRIMTPGQINHVGFKYIILSSREERWAVPLSISNIQRRHCLRNNNSKGHFSAEIRRERQSVPTANFSIIKFLLTTKNMFMGTIQYIWVSTAACVYVCVCTAAICASCVLACLHMWSTTVYHS